MYLDQRIFDTFKSLKKNELEINAITDMQCKFRIFTNSFLRINEK